MTSPVRVWTNGSWPASTSARHWSAVRRSCQTIARVIGSPVRLFQATTVSRWLVMPIAAIRSAARSGDHLDGAGERCTPDLVGVVLDPAGAGLMLRQFALRDAVRRAVGRVEDRAGRGGAFVADEDQALGHCCSAI